MTGFAVPDTVHAAEDGNGDLVLLNRATGRWHKLNRAGTDVFQVLRAAADVEQAVGVLTDRHPDIPENRIRADVERLLAGLVERGLLVLVDDVRRSPAAVLMTPATPRRAISVRQRVTGTVAFVTAMVLLRLPFRITTAAVARFRRVLASRNATPDEAFAALTSAYRVSRFYPGRVACLEVSLTAVLTAALWGRRVDWCFGTAVDPQTFHAWIEVDGEPVTDADEDPIPPTTEKLLAIGLTALTVAAIVLTQSLRRGHHSTDFQMSSTRRTETTGPMTVQHEIEVATDERVKRLAKAQAEAIRDVDGTALNDNDDRTRCGWVLRGCSAATNRTGIP